MKCPYCNFEETRVVDSRETEDLKTTRRRRECAICKKRFTTYERIENGFLVVIKKDGRRETFDRDKLMRSILKACEKRPINIRTIEKIVQDIEDELRKEGEIEVSSKIIGEMVIERLKKLDKVSYIRFASVYREFEDISQFIKEVNDL
ncbi:MAG: transcriptional regulator NrdR [Candidatus Woesearchaeota archaeon]|nr:MAG: transcriptional regulator NrdR [Candidatus Woesearchaeota archaeon]